GVLPRDAEVAAAGAAARGGTRLVGVEERRAAKRHRAADVLLAQAEAHFPAEIVRPVGRRGVEELGIANSRRRRVRGRSTVLDHVEAILDRRIERVLAISPAD